MELSVCFHGVKAGTLATTPDRGIIFRYDREWLSRTDPRPLSLSLPLREEEFTQKACLPYFGGLLPEGDAKRRISEFLHVSESGTIRLLEELGGECAGMVSIVPPGNEPEVCAGAEESAEAAEFELTDVNYRSISIQDIYGMIQGMQTRPLLLAEDGVRLSLAGAQEKIALAYINGSWCVPLDGAPSTHIFKPGYPGESRFPDIAVNEYICMQLAMKLGLPLPETALLDIQGIPVFCIARYDRKTAEISGKPYIRRIHQEDFCQALGIMSDRKYQADGGPSIAQITGLLREYSSSPVLDIPLLMKLVLFQYLIGNCDAHGKNYSILYSESGHIRLAPSYDIISTAVYPGLSRKMSMKIGSAYNLDRIDTADFTELLSSVQLKPSFLADMRKAFSSEFPRAFAETAALPELAFHAGLVHRIAEGFRERLEHI